MVTWGTFKKSMASRSEEVILLLCSVLVRPLQNTVWTGSGSGLPSSKKTDFLEGVQQRAAKMIKGLEHIPYEERLNYLGLFSMGKRMRGDLINVYKCLKGGGRQMDEARLFLMACSYRKRSYGPRCT